MSVVCGKDCSVYIDAVAIDFNSYAKWSLGVLYHI